MANFKYKRKASQLKLEQLAQLENIIEADLTQQGYDAGIWRAGNVVDVIFKEFSVKY